MTAELHSLDRDSASVDGAVPDENSVDGDVGACSSGESRERPGSRAMIRSADVECVLDRMMSLKREIFSINHDFHQSR